jgi:hypothetical protein
LRAAPTQIITAASDRKAEQGLTQVSAKAALLGVIKVARMRMVVFSLCQLKALSRCLDQNPELRRYVVTAAVRNSSPSQGAF